MELEAVCGRFETAWREARKGGFAPRPDDYLASAPEAGRQALLRELIRIDLSYRREAGELPTAEDYQQRFPDLDRTWLVSAVASSTGTLSCISNFNSEDCTNREIPTVSTTVAPMVVRFDDYELLEEIARGGMGVVYKARQVSLNRIVALKMILEHGSPNEEAVQRFHREARAAAALDHPNIVPIYASGQYDGRPYFTMAYVDGENLQERVRREGLPPPPQAAALVQTLAEAAAFAHKHGIIHRDLKPVNVLIDRQGRPRVTDFGLAYRPEAPAAADRLTQAGQVLGTPSYMSPEQATSKHSAIGPATDVYSLGGILYFLLTGQPPFKGHSVSEVLCQVVMQPPASPEQVNPQVPAALAAICLRCLEKDPTNRYPTANALAAALRAPTMEVAAPAAEPPKPVPAKRTRSRRVWVGPALVASLGIAVGIWLTSPYWMKWSVSSLARSNGSGGEGLTPLTPPETIHNQFGLKVAMLAYPNRDALQPDQDGLIRLREGTPVKFRIEVAQDAYVGIWSVNADGTVEQLFPNKEEPDHRFIQNRARIVPKTNAFAERSKGKGTDWIWVQAWSTYWKPDEAKPNSPFPEIRTAKERDEWEEQRRGVTRKTEAKLSEAVIRFRVEP
jgi:serine/threonine protein kinase